MCLLPLAGLILLAIKPLIRVRLLPFVRSWEGEEGREERKCGQKASSCGSTAFNQLLLELFLCNFLVSQKCDHSQQARKLVLPPPASSHLPLLRPFLPSRPLLILRQISPCLLVPKFHRPRICRQGLWCLRHVPGSVPVFVERLADPLLHAGPRQNWHLHARSLLGRSAPIPGG